MTYAACVQLTEFPLPGAAFLVACTDGVSVVKAPLGGIHTRMLTTPFSALEIMLLSRRV